MAWTKDKLSALSASERAQLYANAVSQDTDEGKALAALIEELGLPFSESGGITGDHPLVEAMRSVIFSDEGQRACIEAAESGLPALAGVDPMLAEKFGADYGAHNMTTNWAGSRVGIKKKMECRVYYCSNTYFDFFS